MAVYQYAGIFDRVQPSKTKSIIKQYGYKSFT